MLKLSIPPLGVIVLHNLKPGEQFTYYTGNFEQDIAANQKASTMEPRDFVEKRTFEGLKRYADILHEVRKAAITMKQEGKVRLLERPCDENARRSRFATHTQVRYIAIAV